MDVRFTKATPCCCPSYGDFYIRDRASGKDIYGHETYEYALFKRQGSRIVRRFRTRKQAYAYVSKVTGYTRFDVKMGSTGIIMNDRQYMGVLHGKTLYRISKRTNEVATRPVDDVQLTGWHMKYAECLAEAKEIIEKGDLTT